MGRQPSSNLVFVSQAATLWDDEDPEVRYHPRIFCQLVLPYKHPGEIPFWERRNGDYTLSVRPAIETDADFRCRVGHPFGSLPRLISWIATEAVRTRTPELMLSESLRDFMRQLGLPANGGRAGGITRLRKQANRLFDTSISAQYHGDPRRDIRTWRGRAKFRESFNGQLPYVLTAYPEARVEVTLEGVVFLRGPSRIARKAPLKLELPPA